MTVIVITGASQGIGAEIAKQFAASQPNAILLLLARTEAKLKHVAEQCRTIGADAHYFVCDVTNEEQVKQVATTILKQWSAPDALINNAGYFQSSSFYETTAHEFKSQIDYNLTSAFIVTQAFLPAMMERKKGDIFFVCSTASRLGFSVSPAYCAAKHGLLGLARTLRDETRNKGVRVISVMPGKTLTESWAGTKIPEHYFMPASDVASMIVGAYNLGPRTNIEEIVMRPINSFD